MTSPKEDYNTDKISKPWLMAYAVVLLVLVILIVSFYQFTKYFQ